MATLLHRLGQFAYRRRWLVSALWLLVFAAAGLGAATLSGKTVDTVDIPGQESTTALKLIGERFGAAASGASAQVVLPGPADPAALTRLTGQLTALPGVAGVAEPVIAPDRQAAYLTVSYGVVAGEITDAQREALTDVASGAGAEVTGDVVQPAGAEIGGVGEVIGVIAALIVLALTYGSLVAAGMNLLTAIVGVGIGAAGVAILSRFVDIQSSTPIIAIMLGLAVGIDYALFIFTRFRQELRDGRDVPDAAALAVGTAGSAVVTAGITVVIALAGLAVAGIPFLTEMGMAAAATVVIAVLVAITLVPAVLGFLGHRALPRREDAGRGFYSGWASLVARRRWASLLIALIALVLMSLPVLAMRTTLNQAPPENSTQARATAILSQHFGAGSTGPLLILVDSDGAPGRAATIAQRAAALPDVAAVVPPTPNPDGSAALITVIPASSPDSEATESLVNLLRDTVGGKDVYVTGTTAVNVDVSQQLDEALPKYLILVVGLALVLLVLVFRSVLVPVTGVLGFLLSLGAALGATTAVFQWGWLSGVVRAETVGPLQSLSPIIVIGILFGLAMDYQVFLVSRMHEAHAHGVPPRQAVGTGFRQAAPVVLAAASIMFAVFAGFVPDGDETVKPIAFALAMGIVFDAFVVRLVMVPAALALMGGRAWWLPRWLRWLPAIDVEGTALRHPATDKPALDPVTLMR